MKLLQYWTYGQNIYTYVLWNKLDFCIGNFWVVLSVTRLGDLLDFGQVFKAFGNA